MRVERYGLERIEHFITPALPSVITIILTAVFAIAFSIAFVGGVKYIEKHGLKSIVEQIWEGEKK